MSQNTEKRHPIRVVARRTGLSRDVLRAWELRFDAVEPWRSAGGQRLYSDQDIERLQLLRQVQQLPHTVGRHQVAVHVEHDPSLAVALNGSLLGGGGLHIWHDGQLRCRCGNAAVRSGLRQILVLLHVSDAAKASDAINDPPAL